MYREHFNDLQKRLNIVLPSQDAILCHYLPLFQENKPTPNNLIKLNKRFNVSPANKTRSNSEYKFPNNQKIQHLQHYVLSQKDLNYISTLPLLL